MSTDYGHAVVQFPGFPTIRFSTVNRRMIPPGTERPWGYCQKSFLPSRKIKLKDGTTLLLSKKERSNLRTLIKKWNKRCRWAKTGHGRIYPYRTFEEKNDW